MKLVVSHALPLLFLAVVAVGQGLFAVSLQRMFYAEQGPFYDSMAYYNELARVVSLAQENGVGAGLNRAVSTGTVMVPFALAAMISPFIGMSRELGVWLQVPWVFALLASGYVLFRTRFKAPDWMAVFLALPLTSISAIYFFNGGLSDFRMDLHLYLTFGCAVCWFTTAISSGKYAHWIICGVFVALAGLCRATAPIYLIAVFAPALFVRLLLAPGNWRALVGGPLLSAGVAVVGCGWFFLYRFDYLYFYYFVWNSDANAKLPLSASMQHVNFAFASAGVVVIAACFGASLFSLRFAPPTFKTLKKYVETFPWELLFALLMPVAFLVFRGAGLNPFVSMPSAFGIVAFILTMTGSWAGLSRIRYFCASSVLVVGCLVSSYSGIASHISPVTSFMSGYNTIIDTIESDAEKNELKSVSYATMTLGYLCNDAMFNTLVFDHGYILDKLQTTDQAVTRSGLVIDSGVGLIFTCATYVEWSGIGGQLSSDEERVEFLRTLAKTQITYMLVPSEGTLAWLEKNARHNYANNYSRWIKGIIADDPMWEKISEGIWLAPNEQFTIYRNSALLTKGAHNNTEAQP